jgi:peptidoglycan hydrolase CwlO-like protein/surface antigen
MAGRILSTSVRNKKTMLKTSQKKRKLILWLRSTPVLFVMSLLLVVGSLSHGFGVFAATCTTTTDCQQQISNLSSQNDQTASSLQTLEAQAGSYQAAIDALQSQINSLQSQIAANQAQQAQLQQQIIDAQNKLDQQKSVLANDVKTVYISGQLTPVEMLATSSNLSDYIDKQQAYTAVQNKIQDTLKQIAALQLTLTAQKAQVDQLLSALNAQQAQLTASENEQNSLLSYNQSQQDTFNSQIATNKAQISALQKQQAALIQAGTRNVLIPSPSGGSGGLCDSGYGNGSYPMPWCNAAQDTVATIPYSSDTINRECTSYAYWYFSQVEGHTDLRVDGNANQWLATSNYPTHSTPQDGSLAVETTGAFGHVAVVQALPGETYSGNTVPAGYVLVSEMNYDYNGHFRYSYSPLSKFAGYIY